MRTITAMFDSRAEAENARSRLATVGVSNDDVTIHDKTSLRTDGTDTVADSAARRDHDDGPGIWDRIKAFFSGDDHIYEEGLRRGGYLLTAHVEDQDAERAIDILDDEGTVNLEERQSSWRNDGWAGATGTSTSGVADSPRGDRVRSYDGFRPTR